MSRFPLSSRQGVNGEQPDIVGLAEKFLETVPQAMRELRSEFRSQRGANLTVPQFRVLVRVRQSPATNKELAEFIGVSVAAMSRMVDGMITDGLIERKTSELDRREVRIVLSQTGSKLFSQIRGKARQGVAKRLAGLSKTDLKALNSGLSVLGKAFALS